MALLFNCTACARGVCWCAVVFVAGYGLRVNAWRVVVTCNDCRRARLPSVLLRAGLVDVVLIMPARLLWRGGLLSYFRGVMLERVL